MNAHDFITGQPWAIRAEALTGLLAFADRNPEAVREAFARLPQSVTTRDGRPMDGTEERVTIRDGVATVPVRGVISRYATMLTDICGGTSYERLAKDLQMCMDNHHVRSVLLDIDSPGGTVTGCGETADMIRRMSAKKPICGYVSGLGCSAAYYLASACQAIACHPSATLGSIGTILQVDTRKPKGEMTIVSSQSPLKDADPETTEGRDELQKWVDSLAQVFIDDVARFRGVSAETVLGDFGRGGVMVGASACSAGLADECSTYEDTLARMCRGEFMQGRKPGPTEPAKGNHKERKMPTLNPFAALGRLWANDPKAVEEALIEDDAPAGLAQFVARLQPPAPEARSSTPTDEEIELKIQEEAAKRAAEAARQTVGTFFAQQAKAYFDARVKAGQVLPADVPMLSALYTAMALEDHTGPVAYTDATGKPASISRLSFLTSRIDVKPSNGLTSEVIPADASRLPESLSGLSILPDAAGTPAEAETARKNARMVKMLKATPEGQLVLKEAEMKLVK